MSTYLPEEIVLNILTLLPPKTLLRFRCVCRTWRTLIGNPDFFTQNTLNQSILRLSDRPSPLLLTEANEGSNDSFKRHFYFLSDQTLECQSQIILKGSLFFEVTLVASCNGLLCLCDYTLNKIYLWNPATSDTPRSIPRQRHPPNPFLQVGMLLGTVGFGFDRRSNDFKVLKISHVSSYDSAPCHFNQPVHFQPEVYDYIPCHFNHPFHFQPEVYSSPCHFNHPVYFQPEVYSLSTGTWRLLDLRVPFEQTHELFLNFPILNFPTTAADEIFFWWEVVDRHSHNLINEKIVAFDFNHELFRTTPLPDGAHSTYYSCYHFTVLNGFLTIMGLGFPFEEMRSRSSGLVIWVLFEFGVKESWTKLMNLQLFIENPGRPLGLWKNRELIIQNAKGQLILYNLFTHTKKEVASTHRNTLPLPDFPLQGFPYTCSNSVRRGRIELECNI
ncbi:F-box/kelch-repeat protein At3g06240-like [Corylus avellana]|uniref:F-box/kelch-repeat protein At3g06240-like n=1 Tax=Corylus avellana TaxID=13451 RepID=UPI00286B9687|nr:F-box/kelch-repeat protein At3g06240-like [Corylus avellana]